LLRSCACRTTTIWRTDLPLRGFTPLQSDILSGVAADLRATPMQMALASLLARAPNALLIPGTSSPDNLHENLAAAELRLSKETLAGLGAIGAHQK
jgi:pyridoxine 4-dehydrogenase